MVAPRKSSPARRSGTRSCFIRATGSATESRSFRAKLAELARARGAARSAPQLRDRLADLLGGLVEDREVGATPAHAPVAADEHERAACHAEQARRSVLLAHLAALVGGDGERELVLGSELLVRRQRLRI